MDWMRVKWVNERYKARRKTHRYESKANWDGNVPFELSFIDFIRCTIFLKIDSSTFFSFSWIKSQCYVFYQSKITCSMQRMNRENSDELNECFKSPNHVKCSGINIKNMMWKWKIKKQKKESNSFLIASIDLLLHLFWLLFIYYSLFHIKPCNSSKWNLNFF